MPHKRVRAVFQPHRYSRTLALGKDFPAACEGLDELVLCPVYAASEDPVASGMVQDLYAHFRQSSELIPKMADSLELAWGYLSNSCEAGDILLVIGAGDIVKIAEWASESDAASLLSGGYGDLSIPEGVSRNEDLASKTTLGVGGTADVWSDVTTVDHLSSLLMWAHDNDLPFHVLGGGSNVLVSDMGVRGMTARLTGEVFNAINTTSESTEIIVGAGASLSKLLAWLGNEGLGGWEFVDGIPGVLGGALLMNAGAHGEEICSKISWIRCLNKKGQECILNADEIDWEYRKCSSLKDMIVVDAGLKVNMVDPSRVSEVKSINLKKRSWMKGLRTAGSVFKNPGSSVGGISTAGELLDKVGLKGARVGGAFVAEQHGNVIVTEKGATSSDVKALMLKMQCAVRDECGVMLEPEIVELR
jgi:UDP-N-acetylmuramate--alanine ligase